MKKILLIVALVGLGFGVKYYLDNAGAGECHSPEIKARVKDLFQDNVAAVNGITKTITEWSNGTEKTETMKLELKLVGLSDIYETGYDKNNGVRFCAATAKISGQGELWDSFIKLRTVAQNLSGLITRTGIKLKADEMEIRYNIRQVKKDGAPAYLVELLLE